MSRIRRRDRVAALAVSDLDALHVHPTSVDQAIEEVHCRYGGPGGVTAELAERLDCGRGDAETRICWAIRIVDQLEGR